MVILNIFGKISTTCISQKLKIYLSNLPCESENNWNRELIEDMLQEIKECRIFSERYGKKYLKYNLRKICIETLGANNLPVNMKDEEYLQIIASNLVCIYFNYEYDDMPFLDWTTNCFDGRFCEEDYTEKFIRFLQFIEWRSEKLSSNKQSSFPSLIYTSNHDREYSCLLGVLNYKHQSSEIYINSLKRWGRLFDNYLESENDYLQLDYLINAVYKDNDYNAYHLFKVFSLFELLLVENKKSGSPAQLDKILPLFLPERYSSEDKIDFSKIVRQVRNKISHGDYCRLNELLEKYAQKFMDGQFAFDYTEYSRLNWIYLHLCCELDDMLARMLLSLFTERVEFEKMKQT